MKRIDFELCNLINRGQCQAGRIRVQMLLSRAFLGEFYITVIYFPPEVMVKGNSAWLPLDSELSCSPFEKLYTSLSLVLDSVAY